MPAAQSLHSALLAVAVYFPAMQSSHVPPAGPKCPAEHSQSVMTVLSAGAIDLAGQSVHTVAPAALNWFSAQLPHCPLPTSPLAFPASHAAQASPSGPVYPALHWQSVSAVLASDAVDESLGQLVHTVAAAVSMYVPAKQFSHVVAPASALYVPASQTIGQGPPSVVQHSSVPLPCRFLPSVSILSRSPLAPVYYLAICLSCPYLSLQDRLD